MRRELRAAQASGDLDNTANVGPCVADEEGVYRVVIRDDSLLRALVGELFRANPTAATAHCTRHHPDDAHVHFCMSVRDRSHTVASVTAGLSALQMTPTPQGGEVTCPNYVLANLLRRGLQTAVSVLVCDAVQVLQNDTVHTDEQFAHRCGQLALQQTEPSTEVRGQVCVSDRDVLGADVVLEGAAVAACDRPVVLLPMRQGQTLRAVLTCRRGRPLGHAKFQCVASPSYWPKVYLSSAPSQAVRARLKAAGYSVNRLAVTHDRQRWVRREALVEVGGPDLPTLQPMEKVVVGVEPLGQLPAQECFDRAVAGLLADLREICEKLTACDTEAAWPRSVHHGVPAEAQSAE